MARQSLALEDSAGLLWLEPEARIALGQAIAGARTKRYSPMGVNQDISRPDAYQSSMLEYDTAVN
jgi:hypothetical protein